MNDRAALPAVQQAPWAPPVAVTAETASSAVAAQAKALVEARYIMALRRPRSWDQVRQDILKECRRPSFAHNKSAFYTKPIGQGVEGLGIRFAEVALRCMTNVTVEANTVYDDPGMEIVRVTVTDLEANVPYSTDVRITKTVERSKPMDDGSYLSVRKNSSGKNSYTVPATDEDLLNKRNALISKALRAMALRLIPGDIQDEAEDIIKSTRLNDAAKDPDAERKKIADAFAELNVKAADLTEYLGHPLDACSPAELVNLRGLYGAIRDGEATWAQVVENKAENEDKKRPNGGGGGLPDYPAADFEKNVPKWTKAIAKGERTPDDIIATLGSRNKVSDEQKAAIRALAVADDTLASKEDVAALAKKAEAAAITDADIAKHLGVKNLEKLTVGQLKAARAFVANPTGE